MGGVDVFMAGCSHFSVSQCQLTATGRESLRQSLSLEMEGLVQTDKLAQAPQVSLCDTQADQTCASAGNYCWEKRTV